MKNQFVKINYRPFTEQFYYNDQILSDRLTRKHYEMFGEDLDQENKVICFSGIYSSKPFQCLSVYKIMGFDLLEKTNCLPFYTYLPNGERVENITDWGLAIFRDTYAKITSFEKDVIFRAIEKLDIFHYIYAVLHSPNYRKTYELDLKRDFPRIPLYADFWKYAQAGEKLMELHLNYESPQKITFLKGDVIFTPPLQRKDIDLEVFLEKLRGKKHSTEKAKVSEIVISPILRIKGDSIEIDELTTLSGVAAAALAYKLGNRSAIEWVLDQYKPYKSADASIQERFNNYDFADYKEQVIDLLQQVCFVSMETMKIIREL